MTPPLHCLRTGIKQRTELACNETDQAFVSDDSATLIDKSDSYRADDRTHADCLRQ